MKINYHQYFNTGKPCEINECWLTDCVNKVIKNTVDPINKYMNFNTAI
jgi:hypothetical protein